VRFATVEFPAMPAVKKNRGPSPGARISETRAVRDQSNFFHPITLVPSGRPADRIPSQTIFVILWFIFCPFRYIIENGRIINMATKKKAAPKKAAKKAAKKK
jgi:hypothetical protein